MWDTTYAGYFEEAQRRNLRCGVKDSFIETQFKKYGSVDRKAIQTVLKDKGLYKSSIDGLWGKGTKKAVEQHGLSFNLKDKKIVQELYESLILTFNKKKKDTVNPQTESEMITVISELVSKNWNLIGVKTDQKITISFFVDSSGNIENHQQIKLIKPKPPLKAADLRAFQAAVNTLIKLRTVPIIPNKYPDGLKIVLTLDPSNFYQNNLVTKTKPNPTTKQKEDTRREHPSLIDMLGSLPDSVVCGYATKTYKGRRVWEDPLRWKYSILEAKKRGLECGVEVLKETTTVKKEPAPTKTVTKDPAPTTTAPEIKSCDTDPGSCTITELCKKATTSIANKRSWATTEDSKIYVEEAQKNGVSCSVEPKTVIVEPKLPTCNEQPNLCSVAELCQRATVIQDNRKIWHMCGRAQHILRVLYGTILRYAAENLRKGSSRRRKLCAHCCHRRCV